MARVDLGDFVAHAVDAEGNAGAKALARDHEVGFQPPGANEAAVGELERVRLVEAQERAVAAREFADAGMKPGLGQDDVAVGECRLRQDQRHFPRRQHPLQRRQIIERHDDRVRRRARWQTGGIGHAAAPVVPDQRLVEVAMIVAGENNHLVPAGNEARDAHHLDVRTGRRQRDLPVRAAYPLRQEFGDDHRILAGQQEMHAAPRLAGDRIGDDLVAEANRHAEVADVEIEVLVTVDVGEGRAIAVVDVDRRGPVESGHPGHGHAVRHVRPGTFAKRRGLPGAAQELGVLLAAHDRQLVPIDPIRRD